MLSRPLEKQLLRRESFIRTHLSSSPYSWRTTDFMKSKCLYPHALKHNSSVLTNIYLALFLIFRPGSCYETATTRRFFHGRTETMRPCTVEAQHWCRTMLNPAATVNTLSVHPLCIIKKVRHPKFFLSVYFTQVEEKKQALHAAFNKHNKLMEEAQNGKG